jgi:hypothetical protein
MILTFEEIKKLAKDNGLWREEQTENFIYYDPAVEILIRAAEKLILEKLDTAPKQRPSSAAGWGERDSRMKPKLNRPTLLAAAHGSANTPLRAFVSDKILTVQIGVEVLEWASRPENGGTLERCKVDRRRRIEWAKDVISEMTREDEVGNSPLAQFLDDMMDKAADNGSAALCWPNIKISDTMEQPIIYIVYQECDYGTEIIGAYSSKETAEKVAKEHYGFSEEVEFVKE